MNQLQMLKVALIGYVNSMKAVWSDRLYPLSIISKRKGTLKDYHIYGNTVQDGEPAPENPIPMQSVGDLTVNLFDKDNPNIIKGFINSSDLYIYAHSVARLVWIEIKPNTTYTITKLPQSGICALSSVEPKIDAKVDVRYTYTDLGGTAGEHTVTSGENHKYLVVAIAPTTGGAYTEKEMIDSLQIQMGGTVTPYEPYNKYRIGVVARGKNMLKAPLDVSSWGKQETSKYSYKLNGILPINETVTLSFDYTTLPTYFYFLTDDESISSGGTNANLRTVYLTTDRLVNKKLTFTPKEGKSYYLYSALGANNTSSTAAQAWLDRFTYIQIEYGNEATEYEEYKEPQTFDIFVDEPLRKIEGYEDYIDFEKSIVVRKIAEKVFDGTESWVYESLSYGNNFYTVISNALGNQYLTVLCNKGKHYKGGDLTKNYAVRISSISRYFNYRFQDANNLSTYKQILSDWKEEGNPLYINYVLNVEKEETVDLPSLPQFKGTTVYEVDTTVNPSGMEVCYYE